MKIAIQAADLDAARIDGTRVYIKSLLDRFGGLAPADEFLIYHKNNFNSELEPKNFPNYQIKKIAAPFLWTQTRFAWELLRDDPDVLWMPMHNLPLIKKKKLKTVVTVHDLAYKYFPAYFPKKDLLKLNFLGDLAIKGADKLIAISESTKKDILKFYPSVQAENIKVIHHGFDAELFRRNIPDEEINSILKSYPPATPERSDGGRGNLKPKGYILYFGAIQPRKNLEKLIEAFEIYKKKNGGDLKLVLAGAKAWLWEGIFQKATQSPRAEDIIITGRLKFGTMARLMADARLFVFPSLYEGFGIPVLEAMAAGIPVIAAENSSLMEAGGEAALYFQAADAQELAAKMERALTDEKLRSEMIAKGLEQIKKFSWEKCAQETLDWIKA